MDINSIKQILPHRYPFLLVDRILELEPENRIVGIKNVTANEWFFMGHFPNLPVMPGVLIVEAMAQLAGLLIGKSANTSEAETWYYLTSIKSAKFRTPVIPGDQLRMEVHFLRTKRTIFEISGIASVDSEVVAETDLLIKATSE